MFHTKVMGLTLAKDEKGETRLVLVKRGSDEFRERRGGVCVYLDPLASYTLPATFFHTCRSLGATGLMKELRQSPDRGAPHARKGRMARAQEIGTVRAVEWDRVDVLDEWGNKHRQVVPPGACWISRGPEHADKDVSRGDIQGTVLATLPWPSNSCEGKHSLTEKLLGHE